MAEDEISMFVSYQGEGTPSEAVESILGDYVGLDLQFRKENGAKIYYSGPYWYISCPAGNSIAWNSSAGSETVPQMGWQCYGSGGIFSAYEDFPVDIRKRSFSLNAMPKLPTLSISMPKLPTLADTGLDQTLESVKESYSSVKENSKKALDSASEFWNHPDTQEGVRKAKVATKDGIYCCLAGCATGIAYLVEQAAEASLPKTKSAVLVTVDIAPDRIADFLTAMEDDVKSSRKTSLDPGCLRFDLLQDQEKSNRFVFYEAYTDDDSAAHHKTTSHYKSWADFKASGGVMSQSVAKVESESIGAWAFQGSRKAAAATQPGCAVYVTLEVKEDRIKEFLKAMYVDVRGSRDASLDPGCLRFDILRDRDQPNKFVFFEAYTDSEALKQHQSAAHYQSWANFKASGGVLTQSVTKLTTTTIEGGWAFQA